MDGEGWKRLQRFENGAVRFLTFSCFQRLPLLGTAEWRDVFVESLGAARDRLGFRLLAWVVMPEHVHPVVLPEGCGVPEILRAVKQPVAQRALNRWRAVGAPVLERLAVGKGYRYWQAGGGFDRNLRSWENVVETVEYVHHCPRRFAWACDTRVGGGVDGLGVVVGAVVCGGGWVGDRSGVM